MPFKTDFLVKNAGQLDVPNKRRKKIGEMKGDEIMWKLGAALKIQICEVFCARDRYTQRNFRPMATPHCSLKLTVRKI